MKVSALWTVCTKPGCPEMSFCKPTKSRNLILAQHPKHLRAILTTARPPALRRVQSPRSEHVPGEVDHGVYGRDEILPISAYLLRLVDGGGHGYCPDRGANSCRRHVWHLRPPPGRDVWLEPQCYLAGLFLCRGLRFPRRPHSRIVRRPFWPAQSDPVCRLAVWQWASVVRIPLCLDLALLRAVSVYCARRDWSHDHPLCDGDLSLVRAAAGTSLRLHGRRGGCRRDVCATIGNICNCPLGLALGVCDTRAASVDYHPPGGRPVPSREPATARPAT